MKNRHKIHLGSIGKPLGLDGAFFVFGRDDLLPKIEGNICLNLGKKQLVCRLIRCWWHNSRVVAKLEAFSDRTSLELWKGAELSCQRDQLSLNDKSEYFWSDLISKTVVDSEGYRLGKVARLDNFGASDVVEISDDDGKILALPLVAAYFDMSFQAQDEALRLVVPASTFDEAWQ